MGSLVTVLVLLSLVLGPAGAHNPVMDSLTLTGAPHDSYFPDANDILDVLCQYCLDPHSCLCALRSPSLNLNLNPEWQVTYGRDPSPDPAPAPEPQSSPVYTRPPFSDYIHELNEQATTIQPSTIHCWNDLTYNVGDRTSPPPGQQQEHDAQQHNAQQYSAQQHTTQQQQRRVASRENGFPCTHTGCNRSFNRQCDLRRHKKTHLDPSERPHKCSICHEGFIYPKDRNRHQQRHSREGQLYTCHVVGCHNAAGFSRRDNLLRHLRKQHPDVPVPA